MAPSMARPLLAWLLVMGVSAGGQPAQAQAEGLILPDAPGDPFMLENAGGVDGALALQVFVGDSELCCDGRMPLAGRYSIDDGRVIFDPAFDLVAGQTYAIRVRSGMLEEFTLPSEGNIAGPEVVGIYPSGLEIPENTLRFYIHFAAPMQPHRSEEFIRLLDANGTADTAAFMSFTQELWNEDRTRLTILMDPGRIKRGVATNLELGPALLEGEQYTLAVLPGWPSANGGHVAPGFSHAFTVSAPLRTLPDTALWQIAEPMGGTRDPVVIAFDRPFDHALAQSVIRVLRPEGDVIAGVVELVDHERTWRFTPDTIWPAGPLLIAVDSRLEDVAGNNFRDLLDHAVETEVRLLDQVILTFSPQQ